MKHTYGDIDLDKLLDSLSEKRISLEEAKWLLSAAKTTV